MSSEKKPQAYHLPRGTLSRIVLAHSFAEYDPILQKQGVFVETSPARAADDPELGKSIFVGRRGAGKTAINLHVTGKKLRTAIQLNPKCLMTISRSISADKYQDTRQRPFHILVLVFKLAMLLEGVGRWIELGAVSKHDLPETLDREKNRIGQFDFDSRVLDLFEELEPTLAPGQDKQYFKATRKLFAFVRDIQSLPNTDRFRITIIIDKVDDDWDGRDESVVMLMALMHACVELTPLLKTIRPLLFVRENLFERVRQIDNEFGRLETCVSSLEWTKELLADLVAKRLQYPLNPKPPLPQIWDAYFEHQPATEIRDQILDYCQYRPRDVLTYLSHSIEIAKGSKHEQITVTVHVF